MKNSPVKFVGAAAAAASLGQQQQNPFSPQQQSVMGGVYNPNFSLQRFQTSQAQNKNRYNVGYGKPQQAMNPNTYNQPGIPTEPQTTMNDLQMANAPMGGVGGGGIIEQERGGSRLSGSPVMKVTNTKKLPILTDPIAKASRVLSGGIKKAGDAIKSGIVTYGKHVLSGGSIGKSIRHLKDNYYKQFNTKPDLPTRPPQQHETQKMGLMIKKLRKIPVPQSTTPELSQPTEKSTMGLFNPTPPKKSISELKVLQGVDLSKHKRGPVVVNQGSKKERLRTKINKGDPGYIPDPTKKKN